MAALGEQPVVQLVPQVDGAEHPLRLVVVDDPPHGRRHEAVLALDALARLAREPVLEPVRQRELLDLVAEGREAVQRLALELAHRLEPGAVQGAGREREADHAPTLGPATGPGPGGRARRDSLEP
ncbi:hypothetical protein [Agrococcus sp. SL85]|uniref:hypothetical protein n=1 Tax=Agrococcus sp. SL85 TaxID=2995141 RepID=UPI003B641D2E